jgi:hypothetical protein
MMIILCVQAHHTPVTDCWLRGITLMPPAVQTCMAAAASLRILHGRSLPAAEGRSRRQQRCALI